MCTLDVSWVGVSDDVLRVVGNAVGSDCSNIRAILSIKADAATTPEELTANATLTSNRWEASFVLTPTQRSCVCSPPPGIPLPLYKLKISCPTCGADTVYANGLECCPLITVNQPVFSQICEDPGQLGILRRILHTRFTVTRRNAKGMIQCLVTATATIGQEPPQSSYHQMGAEAQNSTTGLAQETTVFQAEFLVRPGTPVRLTYAVVGAFCKNPVVVDVPAPDPCDDCLGHQPSTGSFQVTDDLTGADLTGAVAAGQCVSATRVRITAPSDARAGRFEWLAPATPDVADPFATVEEVPDTDEGVTVKARIGSRPCETEPEVTVLRCQPRPAFCSHLPVPCGFLENLGLIFFYWSLVFGYVGTILLGAAAYKTFITSLITGAANATATTPVGPVVAGAANLYATVSAWAAAHAATFGLIFFGVGLIGLVIALVCLLLWVNCCAPRKWHCRFYQNLIGIIGLFGMTQLFWAGLVGVACLLLGLSETFVGGLGFSVIFLGVTTGVLYAIVSTVMYLSKCPSISPLELIFGRQS